MTGGGAPESDAEIRRRRIALVAAVVIALLVLGVLVWVSTHRTVVG
jgi:hypothetical protein